MGEVGGVGVEVWVVAFVVVMILVYYFYLNLGFVYLVDEGVVRVILWRGGREL